MNDSLIVGKKVEFSITREENSRGTILDKIVMKEQDREITGYIIEDESGKAWNSIAHWRILRILE